MSTLNEFIYTDEDIICGDKFLNYTTTNNNITYLKTDFFVIKRQFIWRNNIHPTKIQKNIIVGHSDYSFINDYVDIRWKYFVINNCSNKSNVYSIPLGMTNYCDDSPLHKIYGNTELFFKILKTEKIIKNVIYMNFTITTFPQVRQNVYNMFKDKDFVTNGNIDHTLNGRENFLHDIYNHKFCLCPRGNGIDTHRIYEALYLKTIPIVVKHKTHDNLDDLPILFINKWAEIKDYSVDDFNRIYNEMIIKKYNMDKLKMSYWLNFICELTS
jgi:hypothetical protein